MSMPIEWVGDKPADADDWERIIRGRADAIVGSGAVRMRKTDSGWFVEGARKVGGQQGQVPSGSPIVVEQRPPFDMRWHITEALQKAGKPVVGVAMLQGEPPLSREREAAIRSAVGGPWEQPGFDWMMFDVQVVADLLGEVDRLRAKLQLAAHARDLTSQAASKLRDACEDVTPRPVRSFERATPRRSSSDE